MTIWNPREIATQNIDSERASHKDGTYLELPVAMHTPPIRARIRFTIVAAVSFRIVLASGHCFSISDEYSPLRAAMLQWAR